MTFGSLFTGIGGFDLGFENLGMKCLWQVEKDKICRKALARHWPNVTRFCDVKDRNPYEAVNIVCGGDPCPIRSKAKGDRKSRHPDLSGYFLAVCGICRPRWVVRENVPAPDVQDFVAGLEILGYRSVIVRINAAAFSAQNRTRDFVVGCAGEARFEKLLDGIDRKSGARTDSEKHFAPEAHPCLTTHACRYDARDGYIYEGFNRIRTANSVERTRLAGFPDHWLEGFSKTACARMCGNAVVPQVVEEIGKIILETERKE